MNVISKNFVLLPESIIQNINSLNLTKAEKNHSLRFLHNLYKRSMREYETVDGFVETPANYFRKVFNSKYLIWLKKLIDANIIISNPSYSNYISNSFSKSYCINYPNPLPHMLPLFETIPLIAQEYSYKKTPQDEATLLLRKKVIKDFKKLNIDYGKLLEITKKYSDNLKLSDFKVNEQIEKVNMDVCFKAKNVQKTYWMDKDRAIEKATEMGRLLIEDEKRVYILTEEEFICMKRLAIDIAFKDSIKRMQKGIYNVNRNSRNNRLDTNFTNMAKILTDEICRQNKLNQLDLCNSQFALLSDLLEDILDTEDFKIFKEQSYNGTLYEYVQKELGIKNRKTAKVMMFELMFSKETFNSPLKDKLKTLFPSVVKVVDEYKKEHGYNEFSVMLQKREAEIFIDGLWNNINNKKILCITKHDSLIVRQEDSEDVKKEVKRYFEEIGFKGKIIME